MERHCDALALPPLHRGGAGAHHHRGTSCPTPRWCGASAKRRGAGVARDSCCRGPSPTSVWYKLRAVRPTTSSSTGNRAHPVGDRLMHSNDRRRLLDLRLGNEQAQRQQLLGVGEPGVDVAQRLERADHQPEPTSSTSASATCTTTSVLRARWRSRLALERAAAAAQAGGDLRPGVLEHRNRAEQQAGHDDTTNVNSSTVASIGCCRAAAGCRRERDQQRAPRRRRGRARRRRRPGRAPRFRRAARRRSGRGRRRAPRGPRAPAAAPSARTSSRFATLAHAISSTMPIVPISTQSADPTSPITSSFSSRRFG